MTPRSFTRRESLALGLISLAGGGAVSAEEIGKRPLRTQFLLEMHADLEAPQELGRTPYGQRKIYNVRGERFDGPRLSGKLLPGGGDWLIQHSDDSSVLDVRITFQTEDDALIYVSYRGLVYLPPAALAKWEAGQSIHWSEYYFRALASPAGPSRNSEGSRLPEELTSADQYSRGSFYWDPLLSCRPS